MEMAADGRSMRVICSPEWEEDAAVARELLYPPPEAGVPAVPTAVAMGALPVCSGDLPLHPRLAELNPCF